MKDTHTDSATVWSLIKAGQIDKSFTAEACRSQGQLQSGSDKSLSLCVCVWPGKLYILGTKCPHKNGNI